MTEGRRGTADAACARRIRVTTFLELWRWQSRPVKVGALRAPSIRPARRLTPPAGGLCTRCHDVGIADFPATATLLVSVRPCIITSKVKQQVMGSMDQRVPWNQFIREAKVGHSGSPTCDCCGIRRWTCYKKCTSASALSQLLQSVRRESGCTGVCRSDSLDKLMQEECAHFRVGAIGRGKRGPFLSF